MNPIPDPQAGWYCSVFSTVAAALVDVGIGAGTAAVIAPAVVGAGVGALGSAVTGGDPGTGALLGGIGGFAVGPAGLGLVGTDAAASGALTDLGGGITSQALPEVAYGSMTPAQQVAADLAASDSAGAAGFQSELNSILPSASASTAQSGGALSGVLGGAKGISGTSLALGALSGLGSMFGGKPKQYPIGNVQGQISQAATAQEGPLFNAPLSTYGAGTSRTPLTPFANDPNAVYGSGPLPNWFAGNNLQFPYGNNSTAMAQGGALNDAHEMATRAHGTYQAHGSRPFNTRLGDRFLDGDTPGQADTVSAALSDGEMVFDATTVSRAGDGNTRAGAKVFDKLRDYIAERAEPKGQKKYPQGKVGALEPLYEKARREVLGGRK